MIPLPSQDDFNKPLKIPKPRPTFTQRIGKEEAPTLFLFLRQAFPCESSVFLSASPRNQIHAKIATAGLIRFIFLFRSVNAHLNII